MNAALVVGQLQHRIRSFPLHPLHPTINAEYWTGRNTAFKYSVWADRDSNPGYEPQWRMLYNLMFESLSLLYKLLVIFDQVIWMNTQCWNLSIARTICWLHSLNLCLRTQHPICLTFILDSMLLRPFPRKLFRVNSFSYKTPHFIVRIWDIEQFSQRQRRFWY